MSPEKIIDAHVHVMGGTPGVEALGQYEKRQGYAAANFLSIECEPGYGAQNALGILWKLAAPEHYAFGGLHHRFAYDYAEEAAELMAIGFDGMKMLENKPTVRKQLGLPANDPSLDGFYAFMQRGKHPILAHIADPEEFWDRAAIPEWAAKAGWFYDESFVPKEGLTSEALDAVARYPGLPFIFAHFFFLSADLERLDALLDVHPSMHVDITSGTEMYWNFGKRPDDWRAFFLKHPERILYGTDNVDNPEGSVTPDADVINRLQIAFLTEAGEIGAWEHKTFGIHLPSDALEKICAGNFRRLAGDEPRPIDRAAAERYLSNRLNDPRFGLNEAERAITRTVLQALQVR